MEDEFGYLVENDDVEDIESNQYRRLYTPDITSINLTEPNLPEPDIQEQTQATEIDNTFAQIQQPPIFTPPPPRQDTFANIYDTAMNAVNNISFPVYGSKSKVAYIPPDVASELLGMYSNFIDEYKSKLPPDDKYASQLLDIIKAYANAKRAQLEQTNIHILNEETAEQFDTNRVYQDIYYTLRNKYRDAIARIYTDRSSDYVSMLSTAVMDLLFSDNPDKTKQIWNNYGIDINDLISLSNNLPSPNLDEKTLNEVKKVHSSFSLTQALDPDNNIISPKFLAWLPQGLNSVFFKMFGKSGVVLTPVTYALMDTVGLAVSALAGVVNAVANFDYNEIPTTVYETQWLVRKHTDELIKQHFGEGGHSDIINDVANATGQIGGLVFPRLYYAFGTVSGSNPYTALLYGAYLTLKGLEAQGASYIDTLVKGGNYATANMRGIFSGLVNVGIEALPFEKVLVKGGLNLTEAFLKNSRQYRDLLAMSLGRHLVREFMYGSSIEGFEEFLTHIAESSFDKILDSYGATHTPLVTGDFWDFLKETAYVTLLGGIGGASGSAIYNLGGGIRYLKNFNNRRQISGHIRDYERLVYDATTKLTERGTVLEGNVFGVPVQIEMGVFDETDARELSLFLAEASGQMRLPSELVGLQTLANNYLATLERARLTGKINSPEVEEARTALAQAVYNKDNYRALSGLGFDLMHAKVTPVQTETGDVMYKIKVYSDLFESGLLQEVSHPALTNRKILEDRIAHEVGHVILRSMPNEQYQKMLQNLDVEGLRRIASKYGVDQSTVILALSNPQLLVANDDMLEALGYKDVAGSIRLVRSAIEDAVIEQKLLPFIKHSRNVMKLASFYGAKDVLDFYNLLNNGLIPSKPKQETINPTRVQEISNSLEFEKAVEILNSDNVFDIYSYENVLGATVRVLNDENLYERISNPTPELNKAVTRAIYISETVINKVKATPNKQDPKSIELFNEAMANAKSEIVRQAVDSVSQVFDEYEISTPTDLIGLINKVGNALIEIFDTWQDMPEVVKESLDVANSKIGVAVRNTLKTLDKSVQQIEKSIQIDTTDTTSVSDSDVVFGVNLSEANKPVLSLLRGALLSLRGYIVSTTQALGNINSDKQLSEEDNEFVNMLKKTAEGKVNSTVKNLVDALTIVDKAIEKVESRLSEYLSDEDALVSNSAKYKARVEAIKKSSVINQIVNKFPVLDKHAGRLRYLSLSQLNEIRDHINTIENAEEAEKYISGYIHNNDLEEVKFNFISELPVYEKLLQYIVDTEVVSKKEFARVYNRVRKFVDSLVFPKYLSDKYVGRLREVLTDILVISEFMKHRKNVDSLLHNIILDEDADYLDILIDNLSQMHSVASYILSMTNNSVEKIADRLSGLTRFKRIVKGIRGLPHSSLREIVSDKTNAEMVSELFRGEIDADKFYKELIKPKQTRKRKRDIDKVETEVISDEQELNEIILEELETLLETDAEPEIPSGFTTSVQAPLIEKGDKPKPTPKPVVRKRGRKQKIEEEVKTELEQTAQEKESNISPKRRARKTVINDIDTGITEEQKNIIEVVSNSVPEVKKVSDNSVQVSDVIEQSKNKLGATIYPVSDGLNIAFSREYGKEVSKGYKLAYYFLFTRIRYINENALSKLEGKIKELYDNSVLAYNNFKEYLISKYGNKKVNMMFYNHPITEWYKEIDEWVNTGGKSVSTYLGLASKIKDADVDAFITGKRIRRGTDYSASFVGIDSRILDVVTSSTYDGDNVDMFSLDKRVVTPHKVVVNEGEDKGSPGIVYVLNEKFEPIARWLWSLLGRGEYIGDNTKLYVQLYEEYRQGYGMNAVGAMYYELLSRLMFTDSGIEQLNKFKKSGAIADLVNDLIKFGNILSNDSFYKVLNSAVIETLDEISVARGKLTLNRIRNIFLEKLNERIRDTFDNSVVDVFNISDESESSGKTIPNVYVLKTLPSQERFLKEILCFLHNVSLSDETADSYSFVYPDLVKFLNNHIRYMLYNLSLANVKDGSLVIYDAGRISKSVGNSMSVHKNTPFIVYLFILNDLLVSKKLKNNQLQVSFNELNIDGLIDTFILGVYKEANENIRKPQSLQYVDEYGYVRDLEYLLSVNSDELLSRSLEDTVNIWSDTADVLREYYFDLVNKHPHLKDVITNIIISGSLLNKVSNNVNFVIDKSSVIDELLRIQPLSVEVIDRINLWLNPEALQRLGKFAFNVTDPSPLVEDALFKRLAELMQYEDVDERFEKALLYWNELYALMSELVKLDGNWTKETTTGLRSILESKGISNDLLDAVWIDLSKIHYKKRSGVLNSIVSRIAYAQEVLLGSVIIPHIYEGSYIPSRLGSGITFVDILMNDLSRLISSARQLVTMHEVKVATEESDKKEEEIIIPYDGVVIADSLWSLYGTKRRTSFLDTKTEPHKVIPVSRDTISTIGMRYSPKYISLPSIVTAIQMYLSREEMALLTSNDLDTIRSYYSEWVEKKYREYIDSILSDTITETPEQVLEILNNIKDINDIEQLKTTYPSLYKVLDAIRFSIVAMSRNPFSYSMKGVEANISILAREENYYAFLGSLGVIRTYLDRLFGSTAPSDLRKRLYTSMMLPFMNISIMHSTHRDAFKKNVIFRAGLLAGLYEEGVINDIINDAPILVRNVVSAKLKNADDTLLQAYTNKLSDWLLMYRAWLTANYKTFPIESRQVVYPPITELENVERTLYDVLLSDKGIGLKPSPKSGIRSQYHQAIADLFLTTSYILQNLEGYGSHDLSDMDVMDDLISYRLNLETVMELLEQIEKNPNRFKNKTLLLLRNISKDLKSLYGYYNKTVRDAETVMDFPVKKSGVIKYRSLEELYANEDIKQILRQMYGDDYNDVINAEKFIMDLLYDYVRRADIKPVHSVLFGEFGKYIGIMGSGSYKELIQSVNMRNAEKVNKLSDTVISQLSPISYSMFDEIGDTIELKDKFKLLQYTQNQRETLLRSFVTNKVSASFIIPTEELDRMFTPPKRKTSKIYPVFAGISDKLRARGTTKLSRELEELVNDSKRFPILAVSLQNTAVKVQYELPVLFKQLETMFNSTDVSKTELLEVMDNIRNGIKVLWARNELASNIGATLKGFDTGEFNQEEVDKVLNILDIQRGKLRDRLVRIINKRLGARRTPKGDACSFLFDMFDLSSDEVKKIRGELLDLNDLDIISTALGVAIDELSKINIERIDPVYFKLALFGDANVRGAIDRVLGNMESMTRIVSALLDAGIATNVDELIDRLQMDDLTYEELAFMARVIGGELHKSSSLSSKIYSFRVNSLLSGLMTVGKNLSEFVYGAYRLALVDHAEAMLAFMFGDTAKIKSVLIRDKLLVSSLWSKFYSLLWSNLKITFENKMSGMKLRMFSFGSAIKTDKLPPVPLPSTKFGKYFWKTVTFTTSVLYTVDETAKTLFGFWNAVKHSAERAIREGLSDPDEIRNFIMKDLFVEDDSGFIINKYSESWAKAEKEMEAVTFTEMFENKTLQHVHDTLKYQLGLKWLTPFTTVIANMTKVAFRNSLLAFPLEISKIGWAFLSGILGSEVHSIKDIPAYVKAHYVGDSEDKLRKIAEMLCGLIFVYLLPQLFFKFYDDYTFIPQRKRGYLRMDIPDGSVITPSGAVYVLRNFEPLYQTISLNKRILDTIEVLRDKYSKNVLTKADALKAIKEGATGVLTELVDYGALRTLHDVDLVLQQPANVSRLLVNWLGGFVPNIFKYVSNRLLADELYFGRVMNSFSLGDYITAITQIPLDVRHLQISMFGHPVSNPLGKNVLQRVINSVTAGLKPMYFDTPISDRERELYKMIQLASMKTGKEGLYMPPSPVLEYSNISTGGLGRINIVVNPLHLKEMESVIGQLFRNVLLLNYDYLANLYRVNPDGFMDVLDNIHRRISSDVRTVVKNQYSAYAINQLLWYRRMGYTGDVTVENVVKSSVPLGLEFYYQVEPNVYKKYRETLYR